MAQENDGTDGDTFDSLSLMKNLERKAANGLYRRGCPNPVDCGHDVASDLLREHSTYAEDTVTLDHPVANQQLPFLFHCLKFAVSKKKRSCKDCRPGNVAMDEKPELEPLSGPQVDPQTPESLYRGSELIERVLSHIKDPRRREAFRKQVLERASYEEIAKELGVNVRLLRKWVSRDKARLKKRFPTLESLWSDLQFSS